MKLTTSLFLISASNQLMGAVSVVATSGTSVVMPGGSYNQFGDDFSNQQTINISPGGLAAQVTLVNRQYWFSPGVTARQTDAHVSGGGVSMTSAFGFQALETFGPGDVVGAATFHADTTSGTATSMLTFGHSDAPGLVSGYWIDGGTHFLGAEVISGSEHYYGYLQMRVINAGVSPVIQLDGYAWENTPNTPITVVFVPEPTSSLLGGLGLALLARRRR
jgi:hypothetical protein